MSGLTSTLANLAATYTDSEDEDVDHEEPEIRDDDPKSQPEGSSSNSASPLFGVESPKPPTTTSKEGSKSTTGGNTSGLVSYHLDDAIDDDAVDDYHSMDDSSEKDDEGGDSKSPEINILGSEKQDEDMEVVHEDEEIITGTGKKVKIPPEPPGKPSAEFVERIKKLYERKLKQGTNINLYIQSNKQFRNPSIYEKLIKHCNIDELGTNYPPDIYNPHEWLESSYYDELAKVQKADMDRREKEKQERHKERTKVEFISGTAVKKPTGSTAPIPIVGSMSAAIAEAERRKSKWDQRGSMSNLPHNYNAGTLPTSSLTSQAFAVQSNLTTSVTGTKSTVISAFGNLPKKQQSK